MGRDSAAAPALEEPRLLLWTDVCWGGLGSCPGETPLGELLGADPFVLHHPCVVGHP